ncbi:MULTISPECIES: hypothetical protein [unclassified Pseudofrankia]|nr:MULTISPECIES: hypothetical protein [unclassified Pseudofrankia]MDT3440741.1 hypothetical protein [Pseudofrankia sp. BMG5.37]
MSTTVGRDGSGVPLVLTIIWPIDVSMIERRMSAVWVGIAYPFFAVVSN